MPSVFQPKDAATAAMAYLGDAVLELLVRERLVLAGYTSSKSLNAHAKDYVTAPRQAKAMEKILPLLSEEEMAMFKRGRNMGHSNTPKNATVAEYRNATGMEVLFGFLYMMEEKERARRLFAAAYLEDSL